MLLRVPQVATKATTVWRHADASQFTILLCGCIAGQASHMGPATTTLRMHATGECAEELLQEQPAAGQDFGKLY